MSDFRPGVEAARLALARQGVSTPIVTGVHPGGAKGVRISLAEVASRILKGRNDPRVRAWAIRSVKAAGGPQDTLGQAEAIRQALKSATVYVQDPINTEFIQAAADTLCLDDKGLCFKGGDCFLGTESVLKKTTLSTKRVAIGDLEVGDRIWGWNDWTTVMAVVHKGQLNFTAIKIAGRPSPLFLTADHHVYRDGDPENRVRVGDLRMGEVLLQPAYIQGLPPARVLELQPSAKKAVAVDIQTKDHYVYLPDQDVTVSNCDDLCVAYGSATMSIGIPTKIIGECFHGSPTPSHVLCAIQDSTSGEWMRVDPSTNRVVGDYVMGTKEVWIDPLAPSEGLSAVSSESGDYVGVGRLGDASIVPATTPSSWATPAYIAAGAGVVAVGAWLLLRKR